MQASRFGSMLNSLARHSAIHELCFSSHAAALTQAEFEAPRTGFFPSIQATLNHILIIDRFYVDALEGGTLGPAAWADPIPYPTVAELRPAQAAVDRRLIAWCEALGEAGPIGSSMCTAARACRRSGPTACCCTSSSTRSIIAARRTLCSAALRYCHHNSTSSSRLPRRRCVRPNSPSSDRPKRQFGGRETARPERNCRG